MKLKLITTKSISGTHLGTVVAILDFFQKAISQLFEELQGSNSEFKLMTPKSITGTHFRIMAAILDFSKGYISAV